MLKYIGWNNGHEFLSGETLQVEEGVTARVFDEKDENEEEGGAEGDNPEEGAKNPSSWRKGVVFIANVMKEPRVHYFQLPRLGSYIAFSLQFASYLTSIDSFDNGVLIHQKYLQEKEEILRRRQERDAEIQELVREKEESGAEQEEIQLVWD